MNIKNIKNVQKIGDISDLILIILVQNYILFQNLICFYRSRIYIIF